MVMKKLIAISVVFALVAGTAFAEVNVGATTFGKVNVMEGSTKKDTDTFGASGDMGRIRLEASGQNDEETFGGWLRLDAGTYGGIPSAFGYAWWQPIQLIKFLVGTNGGDGLFSADGFTRWGFYQGAGDIGVVKEGWAFGGAFYGGFGAGGATLTITPIEALAINIGVPFFDGGRAEAVYKQTNAQVSYNIDGIGNLAVTFEGHYEGPQDNLPRNKKISIAQPKAGEPYYYYKAISGAGSKFYAFFNLSAIENLGLNIGAGFTLPVKDEDEIAGVKTTDTYNAPVAVGLGASYDAGAFGIKARVQGEFAQSAKSEASWSGGSSSNEFKGPFVLNADLLPSFAINDSMKVFLSAGLSLTGEYKLPKEPDPADPTKTIEKTIDSVVGWHINPYFTKSAGGGTFYAGFRLASAGEKGTAGDGDKALVTWAVPVGVAFSF